MNLLQIVQAFAGRTGLSVPTFVMSNPDPQVLQMLGGLNELVEDLYTRKVTSTVDVEATFVSAGTESEGPITTLAPSGFVSIIPGTFFDRTLRRSLLGGLTPQEWQMRKATLITGPFYDWRLWQGQLWFSPALPVGHTIAFEYRSSWFVYDPVGLTALEYWHLDTDTFPIGDRIAMSWLRWWWKKEKGLEYAEDFAKYERILQTTLASDSGPRSCNMGDGPVNDLLPGIWVPQGSWPV